MKSIKSKNIKWWFTIGSCSVLFLIIGIFAYSKMCFISRGVRIEATLKKASSESEILVVEGTAEKAIQLQMNGREIFIDKDGYFRELVSPLPGFSTITLNAKDKFGNMSVEKFELVSKENAESIAFKKIEEIIN